MTRTHFKMEPFPRVCTFTGSFQVRVLGIMVAVIVLLKLVHCATGSAHFLCNCSNYAGLKHFCLFLLN